MYDVVVLVAQEGKGAVPKQRCKTNPDLQGTVKDGNGIRVPPQDNVKDDHSIRVQPQDNVKDDDDDGIPVRPQAKVQDDDGIRVRPGDDDGIRVGPQANVQDDNDGIRVRPQANVQGVGGIHARLSKSSIATKAEGSPVTKETEAGVDLPPAVVSRPNSTPSTSTQKATCVHKPDTASPCFVLPITRDKKRKFCMLEEAWQKNAQRPSTRNKSIGMAGNADVANSQATISSRKRKRSLEETTSSNTKVQRGFGPVDSSTATAKRGSRKRKADELLDNSKKTSEEVRRQCGKRKRRGS